MAAVLINDSTITCAMSGTVTPASSAKLKVSGSSVLLFDQVASWTVPGCKNPNTVCASVAPPTAGTATKLTVVGIPVLLASFAALGVGSGDAITAIAGQSKLTAV